MRDDFSQCKEEDVGGLAPVKDDDAAMRKISRIDVTLLDGFDYNSHIIEKLNFLLQFVKSSCIIRLVPDNQLKTDD